MVSRPVADGTKLSRVTQEGDFVVEGRVQAKGDVGGEVVCEVEVDALEERGGGGELRMRGRRRWEW